MSYKRNTRDMSYNEQKDEWLKKHPKATADEAYEAGYMQCVDNWCKKER